MYVMCVLIIACYRVGDAMCVIAACTSFPEPFLIPPGQKRLSYAHKKFAGHRSGQKNPTFLYVRTLLLVGHFVMHAC